MKKIFTLAVILSAFVSLSNSSEAFFTKSSDYEVVKSENQNTDIENSETVIVEDNANIQIVKQNEKLGIIDKKTNTYILKPAADSITQFSDENTSEYKLKVKGLTGYINTENGSNFFTPYDDIILVSEFLKIKKSDKYGLIDKHGNVILEPVFEKINVVTNDGDEYIAGKYKGKYRLFTTKGALIPESDLYTVTSSNPEEQANYLLVRDFRPDLKIRKKFNLIVYERVAASDSEIAASDNDENVIYEVKEMKIPGMVRKVNSDIEETDKQPVETVSLPEKNILTIGNKEFYFVPNGDKTGLIDSKGKIILPAEYSHIAAAALAGDTSKSVLIADRDGVYSVFDLKGKLLAEQTYGKINIYQYGKIYTYTRYNDKGILSNNNKVIETVVFDGKDYEFEKNAFTFANIHRINQLLVTLLTID